MNEAAKIENKNLPRYFDYQATTPMDPEVIEAVVDVMKNDFGNPHSRSHFYGWKAEALVENAREEVARLINADPSEIIFTSGATESNNLAIIGVTEYLSDTKNHIITVSTEHKCVLETCRYLETKGFEVTFLPVQTNGLIDLTLLESKITDKTAIVSIMGVNNEIGVIQPLKEIGEITRKHGVFFHTDAAQAFGKIPLDVKEMKIDLMSISGHKIYGPKGIGALYVGKKPRVRLRPLIHGGGQERGMRSGTLPTPLVVGLGGAAKIAGERMEQDTKHIERLSDILYTELTSLPKVILNGDKEQRYHGNLNLSFSGVEGESFIMAVKDLAVSSGSACTSASLEPSYVLHALGVTDDLAHTSIRFGIGRFTTEEDVRFAIDLVKSKVQFLREMSPIWEMIEQGIDINSIEWKGH